MDKSELCSKGGGASSSVSQGESSSSSVSEGKSSTDRRSSDGAPKFWRRFDWDELKDSLKNNYDLLWKSGETTTEDIENFQTKIGTSSLSPEDKLSLAEDCQKLTEELLKRIQLAEDAFFGLYDKLKDAPKPLLLSSDEEFGMITFSSVGGSGSDKQYSARYHKDFKEEKELGEGGFGKVFQCTNIVDKKSYAVKIIPFNDSTKDKTLREVGVLSDLDHTSIIRYYQAWIEERDLEEPEEEDDGDVSRDSEESEEEDGGDVSEENPYVLYIQMELCNSTLRKVIGQGLDNKKAWDYFNQIVEGVCYMHSKGVIHRDLSTINIMIDSRMNIKIADFGLAKTQGALPLLLSRDDIGNLMYRAPEFESVGAEITDKVDIYSLGLILCEMLYKLTTTMGRDKIFGKLKRDSDLPPGQIQSKYGNLILSMVSSVAADRPSAAHILAEILQLDH